MAEQSYDIIWVYVGAASTFLDSPYNLPLRESAPATGYVAAPNQVAIDKGESEAICSQFVKDMLISLLLMLYIMFGNIMGFEIEKIYIICHRDAAACPKPIRFQI